MTFQDFASKTSIHGLSWISTSSNKKMKIYWLIILLGMIGFLIYNIFENVQLYLSHPTDTEILQIREPVQFPQVALCPDSPIQYFHNVTENNLEIYREYFYFYHNVIVELEEVCDEEKTKNFVIGENFSCVHRDLDLDPSSSLAVTPLKRYQKLYDQLKQKINSIISNYMNKFGKDFLEFSFIILSLAEIEKGKVKENSYCTLYMKYSTYEEIVKDGMENEMPSEYLAVDEIIRSFGLECDYSFVIMVNRYPNFFKNESVLLCKKKMFLTKCIYLLFFSEVLETFRHDYSQEIYYKKGNTLKEESFEETWNRFRQIENLLEKFAYIKQQIMKENFSPIPTFTVLKMIYINLRRITFLKYKKEDIIRKIQSTKFNLQEYFEHYQKYSLDHIVNCVYRGRRCKPDELSVKLSEKGPCIIFSAKDDWSYKNSLEILIDMRSPFVLASTSIHGDDNTGALTLKISPKNDSIIFSPLELQLPEAYSTTVLLKGKQMVLESKNNKKCERSETADNLYKCYEKCLVKYIDEKCHCYPFFEKKEPTCTLPEEINCYYAIHKSFDVNQHCKSCKMKCTHFYYRTSLQNSQLLLTSQDKQLLNKRRYKCKEIKKNITNTRCSTDPTDIKSLARINIKFKNPFYLKLFHHTIVDIYTTFSNVGGTMGLCIGMSLISLVEVMDYSITYMLMCRRDYDDIDGTRLTQSVKKQQSLPGKLRKKPCKACTNFKDWATKRGINIGSADDSLSMSTNKCPLARDQLGRNTWSLLHTMAAYYPKEPSIQHQNEMKQFIKTFSTFYPCEHCAIDFREDIKQFPPKVKTREQLNKWFCDRHNTVNRKLGLDEFDCSKVMERWKYGPKDGSCD
ncbi:hypothetical protein SNEBB_004111 [Seison nebaliae]|nr:hypothetical protein SNEBB_004111 [Seison nebaliae]